MLTGDRFYLFSKLEINNIFKYNQLFHKLVEQKGFMIQSLCVIITILRTEN